MFFPIGTDHDGRRPAIATVLLILANLAMYVAMRTGAGVRWEDLATGTGPIDAFVQHFWLNPRDFRWWQLFTSMFVHDPNGIGHIGMNMLFLWVFGKPVESHLGFWRFLLLYLAAGAASGLAQSAASSAPSIGASGAVFGVLGLFVAFFPRSQTQVFYIFLGIGTYMMPSMWLVAIYVIIDLLRQGFEWGGLGRSGIASMAHLGGAAFGLVAGVILLKLKVVPRGEWDLLYVTTQFMRRRQLRAALRGADVTPWMSGKAVGTIAKGGGLDASELRQAELRSLILARLSARDSVRALASYRELLAIVPQAALGADAQLDLANRALAEGDAAIAAIGYRNYITAYRTERRTDDVQLLLALVLVRRLSRPAEAKPLLDGLEERLDEPGQRALAAALSAECAGAPT
ncbi:MAG: rhomboid family intramembrane serine protease [Phycisphaerae bacterium]|nr:rhomboid family intramembrane serine protease [Phycisphaerae bacterium]